MMSSQDFINEIRRLDGESEWPGPQTLEKFPSDKPDEPRWLLGFNFKNPDAQTAAAFARHVGLMDKTEYIECSAGHLAQEHYSWLEHLPELRVATFRSTLAPDCLVALSASQKLQHLTLIGSELTDEHLSMLQGLSHVQCITIVNCKTKRDALLNLRQHVSSVVLAFEWQSGKKLVPLLPAVRGRRDQPDEANRVEKALQRLHDGLASRTPKPTNRFSPPLTDEGRTSLESKLGLILPADVAALLKRHQGQPDWQDGLLCLAPFIEPPEIFRRYQFHLEFGWSEFYWFNYRDTAATYHRLQLPLMGADAHTVHVNALTGQVVETSSYGGNVIANSLDDFLNRIADEVESGIVDYDEQGRIELRSHTNDLRDEGCPMFSA